MKVHERPPELQERIKRTGLFIAYIALSLFFMTTGLILWRWYRR